MVRQAALNDSVPEVRREAAKAGKIKAGLVNLLGLVLPVANLLIFIGD